jgi:hypothetical protein
MKLPSIFYYAEPGKQNAMIRRDLGALLGYLRTDIKTLRSNVQYRWDPAPAPPGLWLGKTTTTVIDATARKDDSRLLQYCCGAEDLSPLVGDRSVRHLTRLVSPVEDVYMLANDMQSHKPRTRILDDQSVSPRELIHGGYGFVICSYSYILLLKQIRDGWEDHLAVWRAKAETPTITPDKRIPRRDFEAHTSD